MTAERKRQAGELLADVRRVDGELAQLKIRLASAVEASRTTVSEIFDVGPIVAAHLIGYTGDVFRFPTAGHYARYNATAPIEASSGPKKRHRLNPRGNRQLNHAIYMIAVTQVRNDTPGRAYFLRKQAEGKSRKEAMRALKRRISDAVYRQLVLDAEVGPGRTSRDDYEVQRGRLSTLTAGSTDEVTPGPTRHAARLPARPFDALETGALTQTGIGVSALAARCEGQRRKDFPVWQFGLLRAASRTSLLPLPARSTAIVRSRPPTERSAVRAPAAD